VSLAWAAEYAFLPLLWDGSAASFRALAALAVTGASVHAYRVHRRVAPLLLAHWALALLMALSPAPSAGGAPGGPRGTINALGRA